MSKEAFLSLLVVCGIALTILTIGLYGEDKKMHDIVKAQADTMEANDELYRRLFIIEATSIDKLNAQVQVQQRTIEMLEQMEDIRNHPKPKGTGI
jgi:hypothetical protein